MTDVTTGTKIVKTRVEIGTENDIEGKIQNEAETMPGGMVVIEVGRGDLGTRKGEAEAQGDIMAMTGMKGEGILGDRAICDEVFCLLGKGLRDIKF